ncbi:unnamed protein product [Oppiella nova]|uniref:Carboxylesterase type B domain-containing protein n=1 Tax=Oppiella nova TaxID=334625 RepID=A0A7R9LR26_9ACAR|nr:unnamed protein product [Oppiella nova]CAG2165780.1 unnamed protein product [Oppiella nova]
MASNTSYQACGQMDSNCDDSHTIGVERTERREGTAQQSLISPSSTIAEQMECHIPALPSQHMYHRCATRSRIALGLICAVLLTFVIFAITAARAKSGLKYGSNGLHHTEGQQWMAEQALGLSQESVVVDTVCGKLIGDEEHEAFVFKNCRHTICCPSNRREAMVNPYTKQIEGKEDCLYLNVWTPNIDPEANSQVMVWIHGGFLQFGSGHQPGLRPNGKLAKSTDTVYVSLNYRLYAFGFMPLDILINSGNNGTKDNNNENVNNSTNFGLMDVVLALQWIQINIKAFGGDPTKVTLFGADSGAALILAIISNNDFKHLYSNSWLIDPALYLNHSFLDADKHNRKNFLKYSGCSSIDPVLIGSTAQAIEFWPGPRDLDTWQWRDYTKYVTTSLDSFSAQISRKSLQLYAPIDDGNETTPAIQYIDMVSDLRQVCPTDYLAQSLAQNSNNSSIYRYIFSARLSEAVSFYC